MFEGLPEPDAAFELPDVPLLFGRFLVLGGHISESDIIEALRVQRDLGAMSAFALIEQGLLSMEELGRLWDCQRRELVSFEDAMCRQGLPAGTDPKTVLKALRGQRTQLGEILVGQGKISREALNALLEQHARHQNEHRGD
ncbi:MAG: hypothetical protein MZV65_24595 [Chromatiales bacterium]|nr:hypothetical protein [Chromatiales bacterium]